MSQTSLRDAKTSLVDALAPLADPGGPLAAVQGFVESEPGSYPIAMVDLADGDEVEQRLDSASNFVTMRFAVHLLVREADEATATATRDEVLDKVLDRLRTGGRADTLGGAVDRVTVETVRRFTVDLGSEVRLGCQVIVALGKLLPIS